MTDDDIRAALSRGETVTMRGTTTGDGKPPTMVAWITPPVEIVFAADQLDVLEMCDAEVDEPWDVGSEWMARRIRALLLGQPPPPPPAHTPEPT